MELSLRGCYSFIEKQSISADLQGISKIIEYYDTIIGIAVEKYLGEVILTFLFVQKYGKRENLKLSAARSDL